MKDLEELKRSVSLLDYVQTATNARIKNVGANTYRVEPCPMCGHNDHFTIYSNTNSYASFNSCCKGGSIIDFLVEYEKMDEKTAINKLYEMAGESKTMTVNQEVRKPKEAVKIETIKKASIDFTEVILKAYNSNTSEDRRYFYIRGLTDKTIDKYKLCKSDLDTLLKGHEDHKPNVPNKAAYQYILPIWSKGKCHYFISRRNDRENTEGQKTLNLKGVSAEIFNLDYIKTPIKQDPDKRERFIFITEGIFDGLSLEELDYKAISLNSVVMAGPFLKAVEEHIETAKDYIYILAGDNDQAGQGMNSKIKERLQALKLPVKVFKIPEEYKDINDYLQVDPESLERQINKLSKNDLVSNYLEDYFINDIEKMKNNKAKKTGFKILDEHLGGIYPGLYVLGGISSVGKTTFIHQIADQLAEQGEHIIFFSLEQSKMELVSKSLSRKTFMIDHKRGKSGLEIMHGASGDILVEAVKNYRKAAYNTSVIEGNFNTTTETIRNYIDEYISFNRSKPLVIVDYLQIIQGADLRMSDKQKIDNNISELKRISRDFDIPVIVISSLNRGNYLAPVDFESFKESGGIEYTADIVLGLQLKVISELEGVNNITDKRNRLNKAKEQVPREIELVCLKNRNGKPFFSCTYDYYPKYNYYEERM